MPIDDPESLNIALHILANSDLERTESYVRQGRPYKHLDAAQLERLYVEGMTKWADSGGHPDSGQLSDDCHAEYSLRGVDPPLQLVEAQIQKVLDKFREFYETINVERAIEINEDLLARYDKSIAKRN